MPRRSATPQFPGLPARLSADAGGLAIGVVVGEVATASAGAAKPDWMKIAPRGDLRCRDGRTYSLDPEAVIARFNADGTRVPVDVGHATVTDNAAPAIGWIEELQARPDGLYGRPEWLEGGRAVLSARTHRYVSPAFHHDDRNAATWLHSVALVAAPALPNMPAVASAQISAQEPSMKGIATAVGLSADASETAILAAISAGFVPKATHDQTLAQLAALSGKLKTIEETAHKEAVEREIEAALKAKKMLPSQKDGFVAMAATPEGFGHVKAILAATAAGSFAAPSSLEGRTAATGAPAEKDAVTLAAEAKKLSAERGISFTDAMSIVSRPATAA